MVEADQRVVDERPRVGDAVEEHGPPGGHCRESEIDLLGRRSQSLSTAGRRVGDREGDPIPGEAAEIMPGGRDRERAARHAGDGSARMNMSLVQEVDLPGVGARGQRAVLRVGRGATEGDLSDRTLPCPIDYRALIALISTFRVAESMGFKGDIREWQNFCRLATEIRRNGSSCVF